MATKEKKLTITELLLSSQVSGACQELADHGYAHRIILIGMNEHNAIMLRGDVGNHYEMIGICDVIKSRLKADFKGDKNESEET